MELDIRDDGKIDISKMMLNGVECDPSEMTVNIGDTVATSFGPITINPGPAYAKRFGNTIKIFRYSISDAIEAYKAGLSENLADDNSTVIDFTIKDVSIQRADDFLNTLIDIYNEKWVDDKAKMAKSTSEVHSRSSARHRTGTRKRRQRHSRLQRRTSRARRSGSFGHVYGRRQ